MARPAISKTPLGQRLTAVRQELGYAARLPFAELLGMHPDTLGGYERGDSVPDLDFITMYKRRFGVNVDWLVTGDGEMFEKKSQAAGVEIAPRLMRDLGLLVLRTHEEVGISLPPEHIAAETAKLYNELVGMVNDIKHDDEVRAYYPVVEFRLKERLREAKASPGTGKRSA